MPVPEAAAYLGCSPAHVRALIRSGALPATRIGHQWFVDEDSMRTTTLRETYSGRPLSQRLVWALLGDWEGRPQSRSLHRQERARLAEYATRDHAQLCHRLKGRASFRACSATSSAIRRLREDRRWVIGGGAAVAQYLEVGDLDGPATFYVPRSLEEAFLDASLAVPDAFQPNLYLGVIDDSCWPFDIEIDRHVWGSVAYLDCREQRIESPRLGVLWPPRAGNLDVQSDGPEEGDARGEGEVN